MADVVALGELLIDFTCQSVDADGYPTMAAHPGGAPANFLAALAKFGAKTALLGKVGNDAFGKLLVKTLADSGIATEGLIVAEDDKLKRNGVFDEAIVNADPNMFYVIYKGLFTKDDYAIIEKWKNAVESNQ